MGLAGQTNDLMEQPVIIIIVMAAKEYSSIIYYSLSDMSTMGYGFVLMGTHIMAGK